ncbi:MAG: long-chain fatty acid--CoA ligase [Gammaproteobacteria bacterium]|nr:long-chain fatty acid--CoA ligase [Gammaproteobacteria bacterium]
MTGLLAHIEQQALRKPDAIAIRSCDDCLSYAELMAAVQQLAGQLQACRINAVGLYLDNGIDWIVVDLAAMSAQIRVVPLPWFFSRAQIEHAIETGGVDHLAVAGELPSGIIGTGIQTQLYAESYLHPIAQIGESAATTSSMGGKLSFTSGSTGTPKGIELTTDFIDQTCASVAEAISGLAIKTHLSVLPYATLLENVAGVYVPLMLGKTVYAEPAQQVGLSTNLRIEPVKLQQIFNRIRPHSMILTPQLLELFCALAESGVIDPRCLLFVAVGGARVGELLMRRARRAGIPAYEGYGLTEFGSVAILNTPQNDRLGSVGKPLPGISTEIAEDGEIILSTRLVADRSDASNQQIVTLKTGDLGSIDSDGFVTILGRKSSLIVLSSGRNVTPEWIETELNASALIHQSYVFTETGSELSALVVAKFPDITDSDLDHEIGKLNHSLPVYAQVKRGYRLPGPFSSGNQMLTVNGRLRRSQINNHLPALLACTRSLASSTGGGAENLSAQEINRC